MAKERPRTWRGNNFHEKVGTWTILLSIRGETLFRKFLVFFSFKKVKQRRLRRLRGGTNQEIVHRVLTKFTAVKNSLG